MAYPKRLIRESRKYDVQVPVEPFECDHYYKPLSYYFNGGSDPTGEHTDLSHPTTYDLPEIISAENAQVDAFADPRTSFFDIVDQVGIDRANKASIAVSDN